MELIAMTWCKNYVERFKASWNGSWAFLYSHLEQYVVWPNGLDICRFQKKLLANDVTYLHKVLTNYIGVTNQK